VLHVGSLEGTCSEMSFGVRGGMCGAAHWKPSVPPASPPVGWVNQLDGGLASAPPGPARLGLELLHVPTQLADVGDGGGEEGRLVGVEGR
jgi:hypothetical protein